MGSESLMKDPYYLRASEVETGVDELALHLQNASRVNPDSSSRKALRKLFAEAWVLDLFERLVKEERLRG